MYFNYDSRQMPIPPMTPGLGAGTMQTPGMMPGFTQTGGTTSIPPFGPMSAMPMAPMTGFPAQPSIPSDFEMAPGAPIQQDINYTQGWLKTQIGQRVKIDFLIGTNMLVDRAGVLLEVGISYVILREAETDDLLLCDIYSIKFVRVYK